MFTQFAGRMAADLPGATALITTIFTLNKPGRLPGLDAGRRPAGPLVRSPARGPRLNLGLGLMLAGVAVWLLTA